MTWIPWSNHARDDDLAGWDDNCPIEANYYHELTPMNDTLQKPFRIAAQFIRLEASAGIILFCMAILALMLDNSPFRHLYQSFIHESFTGSLGPWHFTTATVFWINDVLMSIFFLLVGLEIKREICLGELNSPRKVALPAIAALGGMLIPALVYLAFNSGDSTALRGWAIPTATDIAFALGIISLLGKRVPSALKFYLMALAIFDDLGAILIIAFFYQTHLYWPALIGIVICTGVLFACNRFGMKSLWIYLSLGVVLWIFFLQSGIHPTLAGVLLALMIPLGNRADKNSSPLYRLEKALHPWVAYGVLPLFAFANAGVSFIHVEADQFFGTVSLGIIMGLFLGKQIGVFVPTWLAIRFGIAPMPKGASWYSLYAIAMICGVGFTMSLFIGNLAFTVGDTEHAALVRFGVLAGSFLSGMIGYLLLRKFCSSEKS
jgi:NhaA family Na+:H+ antiporter